jgi:hypothetical protein
MDNKKPSNVITGFWVVIGIMAIIGFAPLVIGIASTLLTIIGVLLLFICIGFGIMVVLNAIGSGFNAIRRGESTKLKSDTWKGAQEGIKKYSTKIWDILFKNNPKEEDDKDKNP